ncbi:MAG: NIPSNAP family protein [Verrucomicrobia bacterium]|nr:NIPSNAP family protein [Verrucomicrobiota bacterium]
MKTDQQSAVLNRWKLKGLIVWSIAGVSFVAGWLVSTRMAHGNEMRADSDHVFELRIYHAAPGKGPALESVFRDASKVMADHGINVIGYWVPNEDPAWKDTLIYVVAHSSREEAKKNWDALHTDPVFRPYIDAAKPLIDKAGKAFRVDEVYMRPTDFSPMR